MMMILQTTAPSHNHHLYLSLHSDSPSGLLNSRRRPLKLSFQNFYPPHFAASPNAKLSIAVPPKLQTCQRELSVERSPEPATPKITENLKSKKPPLWISALSFGSSTWLIHAQLADATELVKLNNPLYETGELFELGIQLSYLLLLLALLGVGSFYVIRQVLVRRELDLSAKELQEQVRSGDANATELFELGAVMLRRKFYPAAVKFLQQAIDKWDGDNQDLAQVYNALGVSYVRDEKIDKGIAQFESAVKIQPGYVTAWNNLGDALEKKEDITAALKAFEEVLLFDPNNKIARPRRDALKDKVAMYRGVPVKTKKKSTMPR